MDGLTIGEVARETGLFAKTIRFYEEQGLLPSPRRSDSGYRLYGPADLARLRLVQRLRLLGLGLPALQTLVGQAFDADCARFGGQLIETIDAQRREVERRLTELESLRADLEALQRHVNHCCEGCPTADMAAECGFCGLISDTEGGEDA